ncbi:MAG: shikimate kinase [Ruminococcaceae bacterium]|nr:shikimate kinase [Oscillospiraceae bacterium]
MRFVLIGMPGCGKSCMGRALQSKLKIRTIDTDKVIEQRQGKKLCEIIDELGLEGFKKLEEETLISLTEDNVIFSTGGSAIYYSRAMEHFKETAKIIYLKCSYKTIERRLGDFSKRGVVLKPGQTLLDLYNERAPLYEKYADAVVNCDGNAYPRYQSEAIKIINGFLSEK